MMIFQTVIVEDRDDDDFQEVAGSWLAASDSRGRTFLLLLFYWISKMGGILRNTETIRAAKKYK